MNVHPITIILLFDDTVVFLLQIRTVYFFSIQY